MESFTNTDKVQLLEGAIHAIVGNNPDDLNLSWLRENKGELLLLLQQRRQLLNSIFLETPAERARMQILNSQLHLLTEQLRVKMADVCEELATRPKDTFTDDYEVTGTLTFSYNSQESILPYEGDDIYGSDFATMIALNDWLPDQAPLHRLELRCRYHDTRKHILESGVLDDGQSWAHDTAGRFEGICICHTTAVFCRDFGYPLVDVLHMNDFWSEVTVTHQHFSTLNND